MAITCAFPAVGRDLERLADAARGKDYGAGLEDAKAPTLTVVAERSHHALAILEEAGDGALLKVFHTLVDAVIL